MEIKPIAVAAVVLLTVGCSSIYLQQRDMPAMLRAGYNDAFYERHHEEYRAQASLHIAHAVQHDLLQLTPLENHERIDRESNTRYLADLRDPPRIGPHMMTYGPHTGQFAWDLYQAIDWTHQHHDQTYDIMADDAIAWQDKAAKTRRSVEWYFDKLEDTARSPAPLDVTMRRAGVMMKPYATLFRTYYPRSATFFFYAHWWHPVIYEAQMIAGNDAEQNEAVSATHALTDEVLDDRPQRMLLSREMMPRYSRMSPASANIFDNLHMLHGIAYDILAYDEWTTAEKRAELQRVIEAMSHHPGDRDLARHFPIPEPDMDPRCYEPWMRDVDGEMNRIMLEMLEEMWPMMGPDDDEEVPDEVVEQFRMKLTPGMQPGEHPGSLPDALREVAPDMQMDHMSTAPGVGNSEMSEMMLDGWRDKTADLEPVDPYPMDEEPNLEEVECNDGVTASRPSVGPASTKGATDE